MRSDSYTRPRVDLLPDAATVTDQPARSVLIIRPSALGDVCRSVPLAVSLRAAFPNARLSWLVQDTFADAIASHPAIDALITFPRARWRRWWLPANALAATRWLVGLRGHFDLVVDAQGLGRSALMALTTGARRRIGYADAREFGWLGVNERRRVEAPHAVDRMLGLLAASGIPPIADLRLFVAEADRAWWANERERRAIGSYAVFAPTSRWTSKAWPSERWRALAPAILNRGFAQIVCLGSPSEREQVAQALPAGAARERVVDLAGATTVGQSMAIIAAADLVIANDSAPLHMAVGFMRPLIALFGPTDPAAVGPYQRDGCVLRSEEARRATARYRDPRLGDRLMRGIAVDDVTRAIDQGLHRAGLAGDR